MICTGDDCGLGKRSRIRKNLVLGRGETTCGPVAIPLDPPEGIIQNICWLVFFFSKQNFIKSICKQCDS